MKHYILVALTMFATHVYAQDSSAIINTSWPGIAADTSLTFRRIAAICDSQFAAAGYSVIPPQGDTANDLDGSSFQSYQLWKSFYATRLDFATGKPHSFAAHAIALLSIEQKNKYHYSI